MLIIGLFYEMIDVGTWYTLLFIGLSMIFRLSFWKVGLWTNKWSQNKNNAQNNSMKRFYSLYHKMLGGIFTLNCLTHDHNFSLLQEISDVPLDTMN